MRRWGRCVGEEGAVEVGGGGLGAVKAVGVAGAWVSVLLMRPTMFAWPSTT
jgi:hypothetical protein